MAQITVYWRPGCPFCRALKLKLALARVPYTPVNIHEDPDAADLVRGVNAGNEVVPTVQIGSTFLTNPSLRAVRSAAAAA